jgi:hypothetical protein
MGRGALGCLALTGLASLCANRLLDKRAQGVQKYLSLSLRPGGVERDSRLATRASGATEERTGVEDQRGTTSQAGPQACQRTSGVAGLEAGGLATAGALQRSGGAVPLSGLTVGRSLASAPGASTGVSSPRGSGVEHLLGKEGVTGSNPVVGSTVRCTRRSRYRPEPVLAVPACVRLCRLRRLRPSGGLTAVGDIGGRGRSRPAAPRRTETIAVPGGDGTIDDLGGIREGHGQGEVRAQ